MGRCSVRVALVALRHRTGNENRVTTLSQSAPPLWSYVPYYEAFSLFEQVGKSPEGCPSPAFRAITEIPLNLNWRTHERVIILKRLYDAAP